MVFKWFCGIQKFSSTFSRSLGDIQRFSESAFEVASTHNFLLFSYLVRNKFISFLKFKDDFLRWNYFHGCFWHLHEFLLLVDKISSCQLFNQFPRRNLKISNSYVISKENSDSPKE